MTSDFLHLTESDSFSSFKPETDARWKLVESAWQMGISRNLLRVEHDSETKGLFTRISDRRVNITSSRDSLNGYQKGRCFYCFDRISIKPGDAELADVDHFIPWSVKDTVPSINGIWNLVLACQDCNRWQKSAQLPHLDFLYRLHARNEYFINSHLPIRETLIHQTGASEAKRRAFLQDSYNLARSKILHIWKKPEPRGTATF
ncbi:HNH endonuclease domain-containing protein [Endozoicomonas elysicola]|uniref:HNH endonuclease domain-containing protein n=1 Tax=Endozoicomonas elysicola TaxID=305900 RepID=UPI0003707B51|nr:HNH endonuclease domain-containing protein [Endozoicomonas elysicola]